MQIYVANLVTGANTFIVSHSLAISGQIKYVLWNQIYVRDFSGNKATAPRIFPLEVRRLPKFINTTLEKYPVLVPIHDINWTFHNITRVLFQILLSVLKTITVMNRPNIIIADDHPASRLGIKFHVKNFQLAENIFEADNGQAVLNLLAANPIHIVLMDMKMPDMDGLEATAAIKRLYPLAKVYIISLYDEEALIFNLIRMGISGYVLKDDTSIEEGITKCCRGDIYFSKKIESVYAKSLQKDAQSKPIKLTPREEKLLPLIARGKNSHEIAEELALSKFTVESYRKELLAKFNMSNSTALVDFAHRTGLL